MSAQVIWTEDEVTVPRAAEAGAVSAILAEPGAWVGDEAPIEPPSTRTARTR